MTKKNQKIQFILIFLGFLLILITYLYFPYMKKAAYIEEKPLEKIDKQEEKLNKILELLQNGNNIPNASK